MVKLADTIRAALGRARSDLDEIRDRIASLHEERRQLLEAPCDREEAEARVDRLLDAARARFSLPSHIFAGGAADAHLGDLGFVNAMRDDMLATFATLAPDGLRKAMLAQLPPNGVGETARSARLAKIKADLRAAEIAEEAALREIEAATGATMPRRANADPAILLAPDKEISA